MHQQLVTIIASRRVGIAAAMLLSLPVSPCRIFAADIDLGDAATLEQLVGQEAVISDGALRFGQFDLIVAPTSTSAPALGEIAVGLNTTADSLQSLLDITISGPSQILAQGESYEFDLSFVVESLNPELQLSQVLLDIDGGTLGTSGTSFVEVASNLNPLGGTVAFSSPQAADVTPTSDLFVINDGDVAQQLFDNFLLPNGISRVAVSTTVRVDGGIDSASGAVLTDFSIGFVRSAAIPEPSTLVLASLMTGGLIARFSRRYR